MFIPMKSIIFTRPKFRIAYGGFDKHSRFRCGLVLFRSQFRGRLGFFVDCDDETDDGLRP